MKYILQTWLIILFFIFWVSNSYAQPIENIFSDIRWDYKYYKELQYLYDKGIIIPNKNGKFNAQSLLKRDEFVGISMKVGCHDCVSPDVDYGFIKKYSKADTFYDVRKENPYFYCISESDSAGDIQWYQKNHTCNSGISSENKRPFCVQDTISLDEALAIIMRVSGFFSIDDNRRVLEKIQSGEISKKLANDVFLKWADGKPYIFYGYIKKALEFSFVDYSSTWEWKIYKLLELKDGKIRPQQSISREDFLQIAYIIWKNTSCSDVETERLSVRVSLWKIKEKKLSVTSEVLWVCNWWIDKDSWYTWRLYHEKTGTEIIKHWDSLVNESLPKNGKWKIFLYTEDSCGNLWKNVSTINIWGEKLSQTSINIQIKSLWDNMVGFDIEWLQESENYSYLWDFWDNQTSIEKDPQHYFAKVGKYPVRLEVHSQKQDILLASTTVNIAWSIASTQSSWVDTDGDWIPDSADSCIFVSGSSLNEGCPILGEFCWSDCECNDWFVCTSSDTAICEESGVCVSNKQELINSCDTNWWNLSIYGNIQCLTCPCDNSLDFYSTIRSCDLIFPAITSPDGKRLYSRWWVYRIN